MSTNLQRLDQIARPDDFDDQKTAAEIASSETSSEDFAQFQEYVLSQIKRIIHGDQTGKWYDDPTEATKNSFREVDCVAGDEVGNCVYIRGDKTGEKWRVETADPKNDAKMPAIGVIDLARNILEAQISDTDCIIQLFGACDLFTDMVPGQAILVGQNGELLDEVPTLSVGEYFWAQQIGVAVASDILLLSGNAVMIRYSG